MSELADRLRALPSFPEDMPDLDPDSVPEDPAVLFLDWLEDELRGGRVRVGAGIEGRHDGRHVLVGSPKLMVERNLSLDAFGDRIGTFESSGATAVDGLAGRSLTRT